MGKIWVLASKFLCSRVTGCKGKQKRIRAVHLRVSWGYQRGKLNVKTLSGKKAQGQIFVGKRQVQSSRKGSLVWVQHPLKPKPGARSNFKQDENLMELQTPQWKQWKEGAKPQLSGQAPEQVIKFYPTKFSLHPQQDTCFVIHFLICPKLGAGLFYRARQLLGSTGAWKEPYPSIPYLPHRAVLGAI